MRNNKEKKPNEIATNDNEMVEERHKKKKKNKKRNFKVYHKTVYRQKQQNSFKQLPFPLPAEH